jgi:hypothetical protein
MESDWAAVVRTRPVGAWRETLGLLAAYADSADWAQVRPWSRLN